jgi:hypothetical protein
MIRRSYVIVALVAAAIAWYFYSDFGASRSFTPTIEIAEGTIVVNNTTGREWRNVVVTVNHHFHGGAPTLAAGGRLSAPLSQFVTGHGQRYDRSRQSVFKVDVTATDSAGEPVRLDWASTQLK